MTGPDETYDPTRHPDLLGWLGERRDAHEEWAGRTGFADALDFTPASLGIVDRLVRAAASSMEEITDRRMTPFVQGAVWYVGEVFRRHRRMVWKYVPDIVSGELEPFFGAAGETSALDHPCVGAPDDPESRLYPLNMLRRILLTEDELGDPVEETLPSIFADPFADPFDEDEDEEGEEGDGDEAEDGEEGDGDEGGEGGDGGGGGGEPGPYAVRPRRPGR
ncbi:MULTISPECIES: hypothetical protein [Streptomyces]|uniref:Uncharacterized protein n=1 Tax=Streptomyces sudanensis TaxID=436397 RepID=A0ABY4TGD4_9ACTN|nr:MULTISPECIES: hypothetical protein [Streptomyces]URN17368.1 hypothetical protein MW084_17175 [Streptomyces sudanensis]